MIGAPSEATTAITGLTYNNLPPKSHEYRNPNADILNLQIPSTPIPSITPTINHPQSITSQSMEMGNMASAFGNRGYLDQIS